MSGVAVKQCAATLASVASSSGEVAYISLVRAASGGLGVQALAPDLGWKLSLVLHAGSSAAGGVASIRRGPNQAHRALCPVDTGSPQERASRVDGAGRVCRSGVG